MKSRLARLIPAVMFPLLMVCLLVIPAGAVSLAVGPSRLTIQNAVPGKDYVRKIR